MRIALILLFIISSITLSAFMIKSAEDKPVHIPPSKQRTGGDAKKGLQYLITGDYVRSGIPYNAFLFGAGLSRENFLQREGLNKNISHEYTAITASNGEVLVAPNCLQCHAQVFDSNLVIGLGNSLIDFTKGEKLNVANIELLERILKNNAPKQYEAAFPFLTVSKAITSYLYAQSKRGEYCRPACWRTGSPQECSDITVE